VPGVLRFDPDRLIALRTKAGLSREQLAVMLGRSYFSVRFYELGKINPPTAIIGRLASLLDCAPSDFFTDEELVGGGVR
jgi:transcriptional regulator with XRE-family HTH domain